MRSYGRYMRAHTCYVCTCTEEECCIALSVGDTGVGNDRRAFPLIHRVKIACNQSIAVDALSSYGGKHKRVPGAHVGSVESYTHKPHLQEKCLPQVMWGCENSSPKQDLLVYVHRVCIGFLCRSMPLWWETSPSEYKNGKEEGCIYCCEKLLYRSWCPLNYQVGKETQEVLVMLL